MTATAIHQSDDSNTSVSGSGMWDLIRTVLASFYILGGIAHLVLAIVSPEVYESFANQALVGPYTTAWKSYIVPHLSLLVPLIGAIELTIGGALLMQNRAPKLAHLSGALFQAGLVLSGPWGPVNGLLALLHILGSRRPYPSSILSRARCWRKK